jgi:CubicO group peptidase (beta-lactamase class C family)
MTRHLNLLIAAILFAARAGGPAIQAQEATLNGIDEYVVKALNDWDVPGVAIGVVKNDQLVFAKGYGVRRAGGPTPVDEKTVFAIGSASKAFTAAAIGMLVDEGKIKWDEPAAKYLPEFELFDPYVTRELTVRDLLTHRSGLERGDLLWYGAALDRDEILRRARYIKPSWSLRSTFGYQNIMYLAAGQITARISGKSWDQFIQDRILVPLGMGASSTSITALKSRENVATPHAKIASPDNAGESKVEQIPWRNIDNIAPAGSINSNVVDMAQWIRLQLGQGSYKDQRLLSSAAAKELHTPQTIIRAEPPWSLFYPESHFIAYGLGWFLHDYKGRKVVEHGGNIDGMSALVAMIPEEQLGVVILTNLSGTALPAALKYRIFDAYLGHPQRDWSANLLKTFKALEAQGQAAAKKLADERVKGTQPSLALEKYAGGYKSDLYGEAKVTRENDKLVLSYGSAFVGDLEHWHYDTFQARWRSRTFPNSQVTFLLNAQGKVEELKLGLPGFADYPFKRIAEPASAAAKEAKQ